MTDRYVVVITGSRSWETEKQRQTILDAMIKQLQVAKSYGDAPDYWDDGKKYKSKPKPVLFVLGCANGVDSMAKSIAENNLWNYVIEYARWEALGKAAGPERNARMLSHGTSVVLAFSDDFTYSKGTANCIKQAKAMGSTIIMYSSEEAT